MTPARLAALLLLFLTCALARADGMSFVMEPFPPFIVDNKGVAEGPFPEIVRATCDALKIQCKLDIYPWRRAYMLAEQGAVDGIFVLLRTPERENDFHFTDPVLQTSYALFMRQPAKLKYAVPKDLNNYTVAVYGPSGTSKAAEEIVKQAPGARMEVEIDNQVVLRKLAAGRYGEQAVAFVNYDVGMHILKQEKIAGLESAGSARKIEYAIGLSRKRVSAEQAEHFNAALRELMKKGTVKAIADKYGMKPAG